MIGQLAAGAVLVAASTMLGFQAAGALRRRCTDLAALSRGLELLSSEIDYGAVPLGPALRRVDAALSGAVGMLLGRAGQEIEAGEPAAAALEGAVARHGGATGLAGPDLALLLTLAPVLGQSGRADQVRHLSRLQGELAVVREQARDRAARFEPICRYSGLLAGLAVWLLLL